MDFVISETNRGKKSLVYDGYMYGVDRVLKDGCIAWRCTNKTCKGRLRTNDDMTKILTVSQGHHHEPKEARRLEIHELRLTMKRKASNDVASSPYQIVKREAGRCYSGGALNSGDKSNLVQCIYRERRKAHQISSKPRQRLRRTSDSSNDTPDEGEDFSDEDAMDSSGSSSESPSPILPKLKGRKQSKPKLLDPKPKKKAPQEEEVEEALDSIHHLHHSADEEEEEEEEGYDDEEEQSRVPRTKRTMEEEEEEEIHSGVEADSEEVQQPAKKKKGRGGGNKAGWSLPDVIEEELVEWLRSNSYLWLRSTKDYKRKKDAWQIKAEELNISVEHLQKWWKNLKDWYVKLLKKTSGQARKTLTGRDKWVLNSLSFYHKKPKCSSSERGKKSRNKKSRKKLKQFQFEEPMVKEENSFDAAHFQEIKIEETDPLTEPYPEDENVVFSERISFKQEPDCWADKQDQVMDGEHSNEGFSHEEIYSEKLQEMQSDVKNEEVFYQSDEINKDSGGRLEGKQSKNNHLSDDPESNPYKYIETTKDIYDTLGMHLANTLRDINDLIVFNRVKNIIDDILLDALAGHFSDPEFEEYSFKYHANCPIVSEEIGDGALPVSSSGDLSNEATGREALPEKVDFGRKTFAQTKLTAPNQQDHMTQTKLSTPNQQKQMVLPDKEAFGRKTFTQTKLAAPNQQDHMTQTKLSTPNQQKQMALPEKVEFDRKTFTETKLAAPNQQDHMTQTKLSTPNQQKNMVAIPVSLSQYQDQTQVNQISSVPINSSLDPTQASIFDSYDRFSPIQNDTVNPYLSNSSNSRNPVIGGNKKDLSQLAKKRKR